MKRANKAKLFTFLIAGVLTAIFFVGCSSEKQYRVLSFFFDGVPQPQNKTDQIISANVPQDSVVEVKKEIKPEYYIHKPYEEEKCNSCHEEGFSNALIKPLPELCYTCHEDFTMKYKSLHGPVASGKCTMCHNQHMAKNENLLERSGQQVCLYCHESSQVLKNKMHEKIENKNCTDCHNPHGGENRGMIKSESCYNCHENFSTKYKFIHGPVASENCLTCHDSHSSGSKNLLLRDSQQLCFYCHNTESIYKNVIHKKNKKSNCTECHNPHGGEDQNLLMSLLKENIKIYVDSISKNKPLNNNQNDSLLNK